MHRWPAAVSGNSAVLCCGLIEATRRPASSSPRPPRGIPRFYAAASLKRRRDGGAGVGASLGIPRFYAAASLKPPGLRHFVLRARRNSAVLCRGLIEAEPKRREVVKWGRGIPRFYAAASLKHTRYPTDRAAPRRIPRFYAAASLKLRGARYRHGALLHEFRGFMPRPH